MPESNPSVSFVDYYAPWCGPCRAMDPFMPELEKEFEGQVTFEKINVDEQQELANQLGIMSIPTMHIKKGDKIIKTLIGYQSKEDLQKEFRAVLVS